MKLVSIIRKQLPMRRVLLSLIPILIFAIYLYGWRVLSLLAVVTICGYGVEYVFERGRKTIPSESFLVTCVLFTLTLPPAIPYWIAVVGILFGLAFGKQVFGGFGRNVFNPALVGRCFIYVAFPNPMTVNWVQPFTGFPGGFGAWAPEFVDAMARATPMLQAKAGTAGYSYLQLLLGNTSGSIGESSALLILLAAIYLIYRKVVNWKVMASMALSMVALNGFLYLFKVQGVHDPLFSLLTGGFLFALVFMATDPVSSPKDGGAKIVYGVLIGIITVIIRSFSLFTEGVMFAILMVNAFVPLLDISMKSLGRKAVSS
jgi:Na+-transporting NADH:ubiquinone oxidoreductase subunit B